MDVANMTTDQVSALKESNPALYKHLIGLAKAMPDVDKEEKDAAKAADAATKAKSEPASDVKAEPMVKESEIPEWAQPLMALAENLNKQTEGIRITEAKAAASKTVDDIVGPSTLPRDVKRAIKAQFAESQGGPEFEQTVSGVLGLAESLFAKSAARPMVTGLGAIAEAGDDTRAATIREATDRIGARFGAPITPRKDQLVFSAEQLGGVTVPSGKGDLGEFAVAEASQDVQDKIAAKF